MVTGPVAFDDPQCGKADLIILLDSSGSITEENWYKVLDFAKEIVDNFAIGPDDIQAGVLSYSNRATIAFHLNDYDNKRDIFRAIDRIPYKDQETNTSGAVRTMYEQMYTFAKGDRASAQNIAIVVTDGESNRDETLTIPESDNARSQGITMFAIGIGDEVNPAELRGIANKPSEEFTFNVTDFDALEHISGSVINATCRTASGKPT